MVKRRRSRQKRTTTASAEKFPAFTHLVRADYPVSFFDGRKSICTLLDAVAMLEEQQPGTDPQSVELRTQLWKLPAGVVTAFATLTGQKTEGPERLSVVLPCFHKIMATTNTGARFEFGPALLDGTQPGPDGSVQLRTGEHVHNVELIRTRIESELTIRQMEILALAIRCSHGREACGYCVDGVYTGIDFSLFSRVQWARLSEIERFIEANATHASRHEISQALSLAGVSLRPRGPTTSP